MAEQPNISQILAALGECSTPMFGMSEMLMEHITAAQRPGGTPLQGQPAVPQPTHNYASAYHTATPPVTAPYNIPQPSHSGSLDLSNIKPVNSGSVSLADAIARARGIAAEKGVSYDSARGSGSEHQYLELEGLCTPELCKTLTI